MAAMQFIFRAVVFSARDCKILPLQELGSSQNEGPILVPLNIRCRHVNYNKKGPIILRTAQPHRRLGEGDETKLAIWFCSRDS